MLDQRKYLRCYILILGTLLYEATTVATNTTNLNLINETNTNVSVLSNSSINTNVSVDISSPMPPMQSTIEPITEILTEIISIPIPNTNQASFGSVGPNQKEQESILRALEWLKLKRASNYGWGNDTHMVILAKELSGTKHLLDTDGHLQLIQELENLLSVKEMEIEILSMLDRHHSLPKPLNLERLARFVLSLGALCNDPKHFHEHDLVAILQHHEPSQDIEFALSTLSACSSAAHVRKRQIRRLLDIASGVTDQSVDTIAMVCLPNIYNRISINLKMFAGYFGITMHCYRSST